MLAADPRADASGVIIHPTRRHVQAVAFEYTKRAWKVLDPSIERDFANLAKLDGGEVSITSRTVDDRWWLVETTSDQRPRRFYLWDRAKQDGAFCSRTGQSWSTSRWPGCPPSRSGRATGSRW